MKPTPKSHPDRSITPGKKKVPRPTRLQTQAQHAERQLNIIQRRMRQTLQAEFARGQLTGPQRLVMETLIRAQGLSVKQLSEAVSLAHSTVSGIVDRLEKQGLLERQANPDDRRFTRLFPSKAVREFLAVQMPALAVHPLLEALRKASPAQRQAITLGLDTLTRLLTEPSSDANLMISSELNVSLPPS